MNKSIRNSMITYGMAFIEINKTLGNKINERDVNKVLLNLTKNDVHETGRITDEVLSASNVLAKFV